MAKAWRDALSGGRIVTCPPVTLEVLYSASGAEAFLELSNALDALRALPLTDSSARSARGAMQQLATRGSGYHRMPPLDYLTAAIAEEAGVVVLHYDGHFDRLAEVLGFQSVWLAPRGSLA